MSKTIKDLERIYAMEQCYKNLLKDYRYELMYKGAPIPNESRLKTWFNRHLKNIEKGRDNEYFKRQEVENGKKN